MIQPSMTCLPYPIREKPLVNQAASVVCYNMPAMREEASLFQTIKKPARRLA